MRRIKFYSWAKKQATREAGLPKYSLRKLAAAAQREDADEHLRALVLLCAHENECVERLMSFVYDDAVREEYEAVEKALGARKVERLALRGTPLMLLPLVYREVLQDFTNDYHTPERNAAEKADLLARSQKALLQRGISPGEVARALELNPSNCYAYLSSGEIGRFTVDTARKIAAYLETA